MALRGFDDYELTLGDEMRGERACLGKTLAEAERDLCIKAELIAAIENADADAFPNRSVVPGYVRAYARYLGMNPDACYERFCHQSGFRSPLVTFGMVPGAAAAQRGAETVAPVGAVGAGLMQSRFVSTPRARRIGAPVSLGGMFSAVALAGLVGGLGYGGYALVQDIQRVGFAPLPEAPAVVADAPVIAAPVLEPGAPAGARPDARAYAGGGVLALSLPATLPEPEIARRDGPISAIDPATSGVFAARLELPATPRTAGRGDDRPLAVFAAVTPVDAAAAGTLDNRVLDSRALDAGAEMHAATDTAAAAPGAAIVGPDHV
ncbi:MAG: helix-turn-helix domain-containing protein, partial [Thermohalobaculum sp.]|nr:helix-turn-helix domain-containing protein [Thermohalobaculum sp.]